MPTGPGGFELRERAAAEWDIELAPLADGKLQVLLDVSNKCNLRCRMCHFSYDSVFYRPAQYMSVDEFSRIASETFPYAREVVLSAGSEPLTSPHFVDILKITAQHRVPEVRFLTNGQLLSGRVAEAVLDYGVTQIDVSIDGATAETYEYIRRGASFDRLVANLSHLTARKAALGLTRPVLQFNLTLMRKNLRELPAFVDLAERLGVSRIGARHLMPYIGLGMEDESLSRIPQEADEHFRRFLDRAANSPVQVINFPDFFHEQARPAPVPPAFAESSAPRPAAPVSDRGAADADVSPAPPSRFVYRGGLGLGTRLRRALGRLGYPVGAPVVPEEPLALRLGRAGLKADVDLPLDDAAVDDLVVFSGWAAPATQVSGVRIERRRFPWDAPAADGDAAPIAVAEADLSTGARPDVLEELAGVSPDQVLGWSYHLKRSELGGAGPVVADFIVVLRTLAGQEFALGERRVRFSEPFGLPHPFGSLDAPRSAVAAIGPTLVLEGWALHAEEVSDVTIEQQVPGPADLGAEAAASLEVGRVKFLNGSRPDVAAAFPGLPLNNRAGWTYQLSRDQLSWDAGRAEISVVAHGANGTRTELGRRELTLRDEDRVAPEVFCSKPFHSVYVDVNGDVNPYPDCRPDAPYGNLLANDGGLEKVWFGEDFRQLRRSIIANDPPAMCEACPNFINRHVNEAAYFEERSVEPQFRRAIGRFTTEAWSLPATGPVRLEGWALSYDSIPAVEIWLDAAETTGATPMSGPKRLGLAQFLDTPAAPEVMRPKYKRFQNRARSNWDFVLQPQDLPEGLLRATLSAKVAVAGLEGVVTIATIRAGAYEEAAT